MLRRDFLGSVLGFLTINGLKYRAVEPIMKPYYDNAKMIRFMRTATQRDLLKCIGHIDFDGIVEATPMKDVDFTLCREGSSSLIFRLEPFITEQTLLFRGLTILRPDGLVVGEGNFNNPGSMRKGDTLIPTFTSRMINAKD